MGKTALRCEQIEIRARMWNEINSYLEVLLYSFLTSCLLLGTYIHYMALFKYV